MSTETRHLPEAPVCLSDTKVVALRDEHTGKVARYRTLQFKGVPAKRRTYISTERAAAILERLRKPAPKK